MSKPAAARDRRRPDAGTDQAVERPSAEPAPLAAQQAELAVPGLAVALRRSGHHGADLLGGSAVDPDTASTLARRRGGGAPLPAEVGGPMGDALGADFSSVRVHADGEADQISRSVQAHAFTYGQDVYFSRGAYAPGSASGQRLLAHELAHVAQGQSGAGGSSGGGSGGGPTIGRADDPAETAADQMADSALASLRRRAAESPMGAEVQEHDDPRPGSAEGEDPTDARLAPLRRRAAQDDVIRRGLWDDFKSAVDMYPRVVQLGKSGKEQVRIRKKGDEAEATQIIAELASTYGIEISATATIDAIKSQYSKVLSKELKKLQASVWEMKELRGLRAAVAHFAPILGAARAGSTLADKAQGVTTIGRVKEAIDVNTAKGKVEDGTMGEYFGGGKNVGLFNTTTDLVDDRYVREGQTKETNDATIEANSIHEMSHGLIEPSELANWIAAMDFWTDKYTPSGKKSAEQPPTEYGRTGGAGEDLAESVAIFFINRPALRKASPSREAFLANMVAKWQPAKVEAVVDSADKASGGEKAPKDEDTAIIQSMSTDAPTQPTDSTPEQPTAVIPEQPTATTAEQPTGSSEELKPVEALSGSK